MAGVDAPTEGPRNLAKAEDEPKHFRLEPEQHRRDSPEDRQLESLQMRPVPDGRGHSGVRRTWCRGHDARLQPVKPCPLQRMIERQGHRPQALAQNPCGTPRVEDAVGIHVPRQGNCQGIGPDQLLDVDRRSRMETRQLDDIPQVIDLDQSRQKAREIGGERRIVLQQQSVLGIAAEKLIERSKVRQVATHFGRVERLSVAPSVPSGVDILDRQDLQPVAIDRRHTMPLDRLAIQPSLHVCHPPGRSVEVDDERLDGQGHRLLPWEGANGRG